MGQASSMGALLLAAGETESDLPSPLQDYDPSAFGRFPGQATDIDIQAREILKIKEN